MYERLKAIIDRADNIVCLAGSPLVEECGYPYVREQESAYDIEDRNGYSPEDLFSTVMLSTRPELFFRYYRQEVLHPEMRPSPTFDALAELERRGKVKSIITRSIYGPATSAGCRTVIELRGSVRSNRCEKCGRRYPMEYVLKKKGIPSCEVCAGKVRPEIVLNGEMIDNGLMTKAAQKISEADVLLVLGTNLKSDLVEKLIQYYNGSELVVINLYPHFSDRIADYVVNESPMNVLPKIL